MAFKFLSIVKANIRIDELETQNAQLVKERDEARTALEGNASEVTKQAEHLQADLDTAVASLKIRTEERDAALADAGAKAKEIETLMAELKAKDGEVNIKVAQGVLDAQAALGQPAAPAIPATAKAPGELHGLARFIAAEKAETATRNARKQ